MEAGAAQECFVGRHLGACAAVRMWPRSSRTERFIAPLAAACLIMLLSCYYSRATLLYYCRTGRVVVVRQHEVSGGFGDSRSGRLTDRRATRVIALTLRLQHPAWRCFIAVV